MRRAITGSLVAAALLALTGCAPSAGPGLERPGRTPQAGPAEEETAAGSVEGVRLRLTVDGTAVDAVMVDNATSREFAALLPVTIRMRDMLGREAYGDGLPAQLTHDADRRTDYEVGELVYWPPTNGVAVYHRVAGTPVPEPGLIPLGRVLGDVEPFNLEGGPAEVTIELGEENRPDGCARVNSGYGPPRGKE